MVVGFNCIRGDSSEMYSVPMMQLMRTYEHQKDNLTEEQYAMIYRVIPIEESGISYYPYCSDCVKNYSGSRDGVWSGGVSGFFGRVRTRRISYEAYRRLLRKNPQHIWLNQFPFVEQVFCCPHL